MTLRHRIIQCDNRRFSLKLEGVFWDCLASLAAERKERLNRLIARLAEEDDSTINLTARLRAYCLTETRRQAGLLDTPVGTQGLLAALECSPSGCLVVDHRRTIAHVNPAFARWFGGGAVRLVGHSLDRHFRVQGPRSIDELWSDLDAGRGGHERVRLVHVGPGRVLSVRARLAAIEGAKRRSPLALVWLMA